MPTIGDKLTIPFEIGRGRRGAIVGDTIPFTIGEGVGPPPLLLPFGRRIGVSGVAFTWGSGSAGHLGQGFSTLANFPWSEPTIFGKGVKQIGMGLGSMIVIIDGEVYMMGHDVGGIGGIGLGPWMPGEGNFIYTPVKVTGGVQQFEEQAYWHLPRIPGARAFRPTGPITPRLGSTNTESPQRAVEVASKGGHHHVRRADGRVMAWGKSYSLGGGWKGEVFIEATLQPAVPNKDEEGGWFMPQCAPNWVCFAWNSAVGIKFGSYTAFGGLESAKFGCDERDGKHRSLLGSVSGTVTPRFTKVDAEKTGVWAPVTPAPLTPPTQNIGKLSAKLDSAGLPITELKVKALAGGLGKGMRIFTNDGTHIQEWVTTATASKNDTKIAVVEQKPNFSYPVNCAVEEGQKFCSVLYTKGSNIITCVGELVKGPSSPTKGVGEWKGLWEKTRPYQKGDLVMKNNIFYLSKQGSVQQPQEGHEPAEDVAGLGTYWELGKYSGEAAREALGMNALANGLTMIGGEYIPGGTYLIKKTTVDAKGAASSTSFEMSQVAINDFVEAGQSTGTAVQSALYVMTTKPNSGSPNPITMVATSDLIIDCKEWKTQGETLLFVRQDAVGGHAITLTNVNWGSDGVPPINTRDREIGPLTFNGDPVVEKSELGNPAKWRYTINTGKEAITMIPLYCNGSNVYAGTVRPLGDGVITAPVVQMSPGKTFVNYLLSDGSIFISGSRSGNDYAFAHREELTESFAGPGHVPQAVEVASGEGSIARMDNGTVRTWGGNQFGQIGNGQEGESSVTAYEPKLGGVPLTGIVEVKATEEDTLVRRNDGRLLSWGNNKQGAAGLGTIKVRVLVPTLIPAGGGVGELPIEPVVQILSSGEPITGQGVKQAACAAALTVGKNLYVWGGNEWTGKDQGGVLGDFSFVHKPSPEKALGVPQTNILGIYGTSGDNMGIIAQATGEPKPAMEVIPVSDGWIVRWRYEEMRAGGVPPREGFKALEYRRTAISMFESEVILEQPPQLGSHAEPSIKSQPIPFPKIPGEIVSYKDNKGHTYTSDGVFYEYKIYTSELGPPPVGAYLAGKDINRIEVEVVAQIVKLTNANNEAEVKFAKPPPGGYPKDVNGNWLIPIECPGPIEPLWETQWKYTSTWKTSGGSIKKQLTNTNGPNVAGPSAGVMTTLVIEPFNTGTGSIPNPMIPTFNGPEGRPDNIEVQVLPGSLGQGRWQNREIASEPLIKQHRIEASLSSTGTWTVPPHKEGGGPPVGVLWAADGEKAGPTNNPFLEWHSFSGPGMDTGTGQGGVSLVTVGDKGELPLQGNYMYRFQLDWWNNEASISKYGDRMELLNYDVGGIGGSSNPANFPAGEAQWGNGVEQWIAFGFYVPEFQLVAGGKAGQYEVGWSEDPEGQYPVCQFHPKGNPSPPWFVRIRGLRGSQGGFTPHMTSETEGGFDLWQESPSFKLKTWYKFVFNFKIATAGFVKLWCDRGDGAGMVKRGEHNFATWNAGWPWLSPCMGSHRNETTVWTPGKPDQFLVPPTLVWYMDGWTFGETKAAVTQNAFGTPIP